MYDEKIHSNCSSEQSVYLNFMKRLQEKINVERFAERVAEEIEKIKDETNDPHGYTHPDYE